MDMRRITLQVKWGHRATYLSQSSRGHFQFLDVGYSNFQRLAVKTNRRHKQLVYWVHER